LGTKYLTLILSAILLFGGLYFKFLYDVPDGEEVTNMWVSWTLTIGGISGIIVSLIWKKRNPMMGESGHDTEADEGIT
jgi:uncharacterized membrane protein